MGKGAGRPRAQAPTVADYWHLFGLNHLPYRILMVARMIDGQAAQHVRAVAGLSVAEWRVLAHLAMMGEQTASTVSAAAYVERSEVSRAVVTLTAAGLLEQRPNPANQKSRLLAVSPAGRERFDRMRQDRRHVFSELMAEFTEDEAAAFDAALLRLARRAERLANDSGSGT